MCVGPCIGHYRGFVLGNMRGVAQQGEEEPNPTNEFGINPDCSRKPLENFELGCYGF